jgi:hypothetical protein
LLVADITKPGFLCDFRRISGYLRQLTVILFGLLSLDCHACNTNAAGEKGAPINPETAFLSVRFNFHPPPA